MIDVHLAAMAWYAAMALIVASVSFLAGMVHQAKLDQERREWEARRRQREMRR